MPTLIGLSYSPWTQKARWALEHHRVRHRFVQYTPMAGEPLLRLAARRLRGKVSVPLLLDGTEVIQDSMRIARYAESIGAGTPLFPPACEADVARWNERSEQVLATGRAIFTIRLGDDPGALAEAVPGALRALLGPLAVPVARLGNRFVQGKYGVAQGDLAVLRDELSSAFDALRAALAGGRPTLLEPGFTYADIAMAVTLQLLAPVDALGARLGPASRAAWGDPELAQRYSDLVAWRDQLYRDYGAYFASHTS